MSQRVLRLEANITDYVWFLTNNGIIVRTKSNTKDKSSANSLLVTCNTTIPPDSNDEKRSQNILARGGVARSKL